MSEVPLYSYEGPVSRSEWLYPLFTGGPPWPVSDRGCVCTMYFEIWNSVNERWKHQRRWCVDAADREHVCARTNRVLFVKGFSLRWVLRVWIDMHVQGSLAH